MNAFMKLHQCSYQAAEEILRERANSGIGAFMRLLVEEEKMRLDKDNVI